jgi:hypothetical protein
MPTLPLSCKIKMHRAIERRWGPFPIRSVQFFHIAGRKWAARFLTNQDGASARHILTARFEGRDNRMTVVATSMVILGAEHAAL